MTAALRLESVSVAGRLAQISLTVAPGTVHALVGPNGAGKSTVLRCALGLEDFTGALTRAPGGVAFVPQRFHHPSAWPMQVAEFLAASRTRWPVCLGFSRATRARVEAALARAELQALADRPLESLSGGELKRVLLVDALEGAPSLLLLDEPEAALDARALAWLERTLAEERARGAAVLWVSHDEARVARVADAVTRLEGGRHA